MSRVNRLVGVACALALGVAAAASADVMVGGSAMLPQKNIVQNAVNLLNVPPNYDYIVSGAVIAAAAALDVYRRSYVETGLRKRTMLIRREKAKSRTTRD